ncbi:hypothetical protein EDB19DRAFT_1835988 [Suillus lakei]|nr:hypothetical protein EDB19DRAFT_1835988 [Suillus lakei]
MIVEDITGKMIHFTKSVFMPRDIMIPNSPHGQAAVDAPVMDEETNNWAIPDDFSKDFNTLKYRMKADPLPLYHENHLINPMHMNKIISSALVEVQFSLQHWHIKDYDTFQATAQKITILKLGAIHVPSNYKCPNPSGDKTIPGQPETKRCNMRRKQALEIG